MPFGEAVRDGAGVGRVPDHGSRDRVDRGHFRRDRAQAPVAGRAVGIERRDGCFGVAHGRSELAGRLGGAGGMAMAVVTEVRRPLALLVHANAGGGGPCPLGGHDHGEQEQQESAHQGSEGEGRFGRAALTLRAGFAAVWRDSIEACPTGSQHQDDNFVIFGT